MEASTPAALHSSFISLQICLLPSPLPPFVTKISPEAFKDLAPGKYSLGFYFDDPFSTVVTGQVTVKVENGGSEGDGSTDKDDDTTGSDTDKDEETEEA